MQFVALGNKGGLITILDKNALKVDGVSYTQEQAKKEVYFARRVPPQTRRGAAPKSRSRAHVMHFKLAGGPRKAKAGGSYDSRRLPR